jgi:GT2 family glycosyltransferase
MELSIIIVTYKGWDRLIKCLDSLNSFSGRLFSAEVIVVDNKSDDETIHDIEKKFPKFRFIYNDVNGGFGNGSNIGAKNSSGEFILFLNPDTIASESDIQKLLSTSRQHPEFDILSCRQINEKGKENITYNHFPSLFNLTGLQRAVFKRHNSNSSISTQEISFPDWISGSVVMMNRKTFLRLKGFDEDFWMYFEDVDICKRVSEMSGIVAFCRMITIEHNHGGSSRINLRITSLTKTEVHISRHIYISKHKKGVEMLLIQIFLVINNLISGGIMALTGLLLFFVPKVFCRTLIFCRLTGYYIGALCRLSWISPRSVNFKKTPEDA